MNRASSELNTIKRTTSLEHTKWYMGMLLTHLVDEQDTNGAFSLLEATVVPGTEPPPHVHSREDELFYVLEGQFDVYVGDKTFSVIAGECIFLPRLKPHAFVIRSPELRVLILYTHAGLEDAFRSVSVPAQRLELPHWALTYSMSDIDLTTRRFADYGVHILAPHEVAQRLPTYPQPLPRS
jgi:mannose-6-phosphate isomerase-like protein (cupin superfamily)